jgi:hypothetical protein
LVVLLAPMLARADYSDDYIAGLAALDHGRYVQAVEYLQRALDARSGRVSWLMIQGNRQPYLPHHFLGVAKFKLGDCAAASAQWSDPDNLRALSRLRSLRNEEEQMLAHCKPGSAVAEAAPATPTPASPPPASTESGASAATDTTQPATSSGASSTTKPSAGQTPASLLRAFEDYVDGRYARASRLDVDSMNDARARYQAYLLRAAARYALSRLGAGKSLLDAARRDARAAWALDKSEPDERVFSPSFRAFYSAAH